MDLKLYYWTDDEILQEAKKYNTRKEFATGSASAYETARKRGLLEEACKHMEVLINKWTYEMVSNAASKFNTRYEFQKGNLAAYAASRKLGCTDEICSHMEDGRRSDNDAIYLWMDNHTGAFKVGVTSGRLGCDRIHHVANVGDISDYTIIRCIHLPEGIKATDIETQLLKLGDETEHDNFDGCTEFRYLSDDELNEAIELIDQQGGISLNE